MITADTLKILSTMTATGLKQVLAASGYTGCTFKTAKFLGLTNGGDFCYTVTYFDDAGTGEDAVGKVFVKYNIEKQEITADF